MFSLVFRAALLEPEAFDQLRQAESSAIYALGTVIIAALAFGAGILGVAYRTIEDPPVELAPVTIMSVLLGWVIWTFVSYFVGSRLMGGKATYREILHALGICFAPGVMMVTIAIPGEAGLIGFSFATFWMLSAGLIAVKETQQVSLRRVFLPTLIGWLPLVWFGWSILAVMSNLE